ncbi:MAG: IclR family transcriptional regulator [Nocardioidaceae bacterium]|nr:IclR family transcriptional regulator [Nocardioidaceae bacterium]
MSERGAAPATSRTAERIVDLLTLLGSRDQPFTALEIAAEVGIPKSSTHQLLNYLATRDVVRYDPVQRTWGLGVAVFQLGAAYKRSRPLEVVGRGILVDVAQATSTTTHLAVLEGRDVLYVDKQQQRTGTGTTQLVTETGVRLPAHLTAVGRALLSTFSDERLTELYRDYEFVRRTSLGPESLTELLRDLARVRADGFAIESGLTTAGITCLAAPVFEQGPEAVAALGITFVTDQMSPEQVDQHARTVQDFAHRLSADLGWAPGTSEGQ